MRGQDSAVGPIQYTLTADDLADGAAPTASSQVGTRDAALGGELEHQVAARDPAGGELEHQVGRARRGAGDELVHQVGRARRRRA